MEQLTQEALQELLHYELSPCVSLYMPTFQAAPEWEKNRIRLKNLVGEARRQLVERPAQEAQTMDHPTIDRLLAPAERLIGRSRAGAFHGQGLAIFLGPAFARLYSLPLPFQPLALVSGRFHIKPLLPLFTNNTAYFVLSLSQDEAHFWQGTRFALKPMDLEGFPVRFKEITALEEAERQVQFHTRTRPMAGGAARQAVFHGNADERLKQSRLRRYFGLIDERLRPVLGQAQRPLVLAGVDYLFPLYREANSYAHLIDAGVAGSPEGMSVDELHQRTWAVLQPFVAQETKAAIARYAALSDTGRAGADLAEILAAARHGRVDTLFAARDRQRWGILMSPGDGIREADGPAAVHDTVDLLDEAVVQTLLHGGTAYLLDPAAVPGGGDLAAVYRY